MAQISPFVDPNTGDFLTENGIIINKNQIESLVIARLKTPKGSYIFDKNFGNPLQNPTNIGTDSNPQSLQRQVKSALEDLIVRGVVQNIIVEPPNFSADQRVIDFSIYIIDNQGNPPQKFTWSLET